MAISDEGFYPGTAPIDGYGGGGFRFAGMSHRARSWLCDRHPCLERCRRGRHDAEALQAVFDLAPGTVEFLILGTGVDLIAPLPSLRQQLRAAGITVEAMATGAALRTYNVVLGEGRAVAAALLAVE